MHDYKFTKKGMSLILQGHCLQPDLYLLSWLCSLIVSVACDDLSIYPSILSASKKKIHWSSLHTSSANSWISRLRHFTWRSEKNLYSICLSTKTHWKKYSDVLCLSGWGWGTYVTCSLWWTNGSILHRICMVLPLASVVSSWFFFCWNEHIPEHRQPFAWFWIGHGLWNHDLWVACDTLAA